MVGALRQDTRTRLRNMLGEKAAYVERRGGVLTGDALFAAAQADIEWPTEDHIHNENGKTQDTAGADNYVAPIHGPQAKQTTCGNQDNLSTSNGSKTAKLATKS